MKVLFYIIAALTAGVALIAFFMSAQSGFQDRDVEGFFNLALYSCVFAFMGKVIDLLEGLDGKRAERKELAERKEREASRYEYMHDKPA